MGDEGIDVFVHNNQQEWCEGQKDNNFFFFLLTSLRLFLYCYTTS